MYLKIFSANANPAIIPSSFISSWALLPAFSEIDPNEEWSPSPISSANADFIKALIMDQNLWL